MKKQCLNILYCLTMVTAFSGCGNENDQKTLTNTETSAQTIAPEAARVTETNEKDSASKATTVIATNENVEVDEDKLLRKGKILFLQCRACHSLEPDGEHLIGPNLHALFDSQAGRKSGFTYSEAMSGSKVKWNDTTLDTFLIKPSDYMPGTIMAFVGVEKPEDRAAIILYLKNNT